MIKEQDLLEAIAECQGERNPNANTCIKLAAYYTILNNMKTDEPREEQAQASYAGYSYDEQPAEQTVIYTSESDFGKTLPKLDQLEAMRVVDELMETLRIIHPRLYEATMRNLTALE